MPLFHRTKQVEPRSIDLKSFAAVEPSIAVIDQVMSEMTIDEKDEVPRQDSLVDPLACSDIPETEQQAQRLIERLVEKTAQSSKTIAGHLTYYLKKTHTDAHRNSAPSREPSKPTVKRSLTIDSVGIRVVQEDGTPVSETHPHAFSPTLESVEGVGLKVRDEVVDKSIRTIAGKVVGFRRLGEASCRVAVDVVEVGFVVHNNVRAPAYRMMLSCVFGSYADYIIDETHVHVRFFAPELPSTTDTTSSLSPSLSGLFSGPMSDVIDLPGAPRILTVAPRGCYGVEDISSGKQEVKLNPHIDVAGVGAALGEVSATRETRYHTRWSIKGIIGQKKSCDDTVWWSTKANANRDDGVPQTLKLIALVNHEGQRHKPLTASVSVRWALRTRGVPDFVRPLFGWQKKLRGEFNIAYDGEPRSLDILPCTPESLDELVKSDWGPPESQLSGVESLQPLQGDLPHTASEDVDLISFV